MNATSKRAQSRSVARLAAVQALYQQEMEGTALTKLLDEFHQHRLGREIDETDFAEAETEFFDDIVTGVDTRREDIDAALSPHLAEGWSLKRLDKTMLQVLRAGAYELIARADVPTGTAINEYIDVAKAFFDDKQAKFANGVLDAVAKDTRA
jgi:N utilization substance protein B